MGESAAHQEVMRGGPSASAIGVAVTVVEEHFPESGSKGQVTTIPTSSGTNSCGVWYEHSQHRPSKDHSYIPKEDILEPSEHRPE